MALITQTCPDPNTALFREGTVLLAVLLMMKAGVQMYRLNVKKHKQYMHAEITQLELRVAALEQRSIKKEVIKKVRLQDASTQTDPTEDVLPLGDEDIIVID